MKDGIVRGVGLGIGVIVNLNMSGGIAKDFYLLILLWLVFLFVGLFGVRSMKYDMVCGCSIFIGRVQFSFVELRSDEFSDELG